MKLSLSDQKMRFRVSAEELEHLLRGEKIETHLCLKGQDFFCRILRYPGGGMSAELLEDGIALYISREMLFALRDLGRSKEGLSVEQDGLAISLQLDLKTLSRSTA